MIFCWFHGACWLLNNFNYIKVVAKKSQSHNKGVKIYKYFQAKTIKISLKKKIALQKRKTHEKVTLKISKSFRQNLSQNTTFLEIVFLNQNKLF